MPRSVLQGTLQTLRQELVASARQVCTMGLLYRPSCICDCIMTACKVSVGQNGWAFYKNRMGYKAYPDQGVHMQQPYVRFGEGFRPMYAHVSVLAHAHEIAVSGYSIAGFLLLAIIMLCEFHNSCHRWQPEDACSVCQHSSAQQECWAGEGQICGANWAARLPGNASEPARPIVLLASIIVAFASRRSPGMCHESLLHAIHPRT